MVGKIEMPTNILRQVSRTFALTIPMLNAPLIPIITDAYLFLRILDTVEDEEALQYDEQVFLIHQWIDVLKKPQLVQEFVDQITPKLTKSTIPSEKQLIKDAPTLIKRILTYDTAVIESIHKVGQIMGKGMLKFLSRKGQDRVQSIAELEEYCYYVAGCVGEMLTEIFCHIGGFNQKKDALLKLSDDFGKGLQLTNILKDVEKDRLRGVEWIPKTFRNDSGFNKIIENTREFLHKSLDYICIVPKNHHKIRRFCLVNTLLALATLRCISKGGKKISKLTLFLHVALSKFLCWSDRLVQLCKIV